MEMGVVSMRNAASFRNQADLIVKIARQKGFGVKDLTLAEACVGPPKYRFDKLIALIPLWPRYLFDVLRLTAWMSKAHVIYGPVDGPYQLNIGLFKIMRNMTLCAPSRWCAEMIRKSTEQPCLYNPHGIDHKDFVFSEDRIEGQRKTWLKGKSERTILFANLNPIHRKGFPHLCRAIGLLYERLGEKFLFVLHTGLKPALKLYPKLNKTPCLVIEDSFNTLPFRAIALKTVAADIYVNPSLQEGFGLPVLEAMTGKTVVVTSDAPSVNELVGDNEAFVFPITKVREEKWNNGFLAQLHEYEPSSLADAMERAITDKKGRETKVAAAYQKSLKYDYRTVYSRLIELCA